MTPVGHSLAGYAIYNFSMAATNRNRLKLASLCMFMATAADLDIVPGIVVGRPDLYHHGITHSLGFALIFSLAVSGIISIRMRPFSQIFSLCFISYLSHIVIDFFSYFGSYTYTGGMPLFWPISGEKFYSPVGLYMAVHYDRLPSASIIEWIKSMFNLYNTGAIAHEVALILPFILLGQLYRRLYRTDQLA